LVSEFATRNTKVSFHAADERSYNEMLELKQDQIKEVLLGDAQQKLAMNLIQQGADPESEEFQQQMSPESLKTLPQIQSFFKKNYRNIPEKWAEHQKEVDIERFKMEELEERGFRDSLIADREFWHYKMLEDDYDIELWNPVLTFYHKSPSARYISEGFSVGKIDMLTIADVIDGYGWLMNEEQLESLERFYPIKAAGYNIPGKQNDGSFYDATRSHDWNTKGPSLAYRQFTSMWDNVQGGGDIVNMILSESDDYFDEGLGNMLRVTTAYWKSQRRVGHLTKIDEAGNVIQDIIDEIYRVTDKPVYDTTLFKKKDKSNLLFGEHIDWIYINHVWGGVKIGPNLPGFWGTRGDSNEINPIYLGINQNQIGPVKFQFKGNNSLYGCKLPVEGAVFSDRNTRSSSLVDMMKPFQIGYNIVNNQIADILVDELGTIILLDQNALPRHSLGEDWGKNNLAKAYVAMKNFQMLPLDTSITNTENPLAFQHFQTLNLEQTNRLMSRIQLANYFKNEAFATIGITPQRLGAAVEQATAEGIKVSVTNSYAQTEMYFIQHCDHLMPRVHQMRTDLAQYYNSTKASARLQYMTNMEERINFEINGKDLFLRDINVFCTTRANSRSILEKLKQLMITNNTTGASIFDIGSVIKSDSIAEVTQVMKESVERADMQRQQEMQQQQQMQEQQLQAQQAEAQAAREFQAAENDKDRQADIVEAQIKAAGYGAMKDINVNQQSDYLDALNYIKGTEEYSDTMGFEREKENNKVRLNQDKQQLTREKLQVAREKSQNDLKIARENKTNMELNAQKKAKLNKKKK